MRIEFMGLLIGWLRAVRESDAVPNLSWCGPFSSYLFTLVIHGTETTFLMTLKEWELCSRRADHSALGLGACPLTFLFFRLFIGKS